MNKDEINQFIEIINNLHKDAKLKGIKKGKGGASSMKCPRCREGQINYSVASVNGYMWARCTTQDCVCFIE